MRISTPIRGLLVAATLFLALPAAQAQTTIAAARAAGAGATVTVTGVVTRSKGAFTQFQDATGGLSIRQFGGAFFDAVAAGTIAPGTTLTVTGTLSQFRGLLQINQPSATANDLASFTAGATVAIPAAQTVTLAQLATNGEDYESELVRVQNITITGASPFTAATTYQITDASSSNNLVSLRIVGANDTDVDGLAVPTPTATVTGVISQFDTATPAVMGYQIQPILASDIAAGGTATAETPDGTLSLSVANPLRGTATVRFSTETAQDVRVALYDVLGRTVRTVASGASFGARTASLDTAGLAPGVYVLRLTAGASQISQTVTVAR